MVGALLLTGACGSKQEKPAAIDAADSVAIVQNQLPGDSAIYGIVCEGCNDTILIFLPSISADPDTIDILEASKRHQVFGRMNIGDVVAFIPNTEDAKVGDMVVNVEALKGQWCFMEKPQLRERAGMNVAERPKLTPEQDSVLREMLQLREFGMEIKGENTVRPISSIPYSVSTDDNSPVIFPQVKRYRQWHLLNGKLLLSETLRDSTGTPTVSHTDTATLIVLRSDTMALRFQDGKVQGYYKTK